MDDSGLFGRDFLFLTFRSTVSLWSSGDDCASNAGSRLLKGAALSRRSHHYEKLKTGKMLRFLAVYMVHFTVLQDKCDFGNISKLL